MGLFGAGVVEGMCFRIECGLSDLWYNQMILHCSDGY